MDEQTRELANKFFVDREPETTEEKLAYATAILEIYADPANWHINNDRRHGEHRMGERIVLRTGNIVAGYLFAYEFIERVRDKPSVTVKPVVQSNRDYGREFVIFCFGAATAIMVIHALQLLVFN